jgi:site-specific DNA-cytosine methylase
MWSFLTNTVCHKGVFSKSVEEATSPNYLKCNPPSDDYTRNGTGKGGDGNSGLFVRLPAIILKLQPESFLITISDNVYNIHDGVELSSVKQNLTGKYILFESTLPVWKYGDPTARNWLHIVGISRKLGQRAYDFRFPKPKFDATLWPRARGIADPDCDVPDECWLDGNIQIAHQGTIKPERPSIHRISTAKRKSGVSARALGVLLGGSAQ